MNFRNKVFWALDALKGGKYKSSLEKIRHEFSETTPMDVKVKLHNDRLRGILQKASENIPYYRTIGKDELQHFPIVSKEIIRENISSFLADGINTQQLSSRYTSGSTGAPFLFYFGPEKVFYNHVSLLLHNIENGYNIGDRMFYFRAWNNGNKYSKMHMLKTNLVMQDCSATKENVVQLVKALKGSSNNVFWGYSSAVIAYAKRILKSNEIGNSVKVIYTSSDLLSDTDRDYVASKFNCPVFSRYSDEEVGIISQQYKMELPKFRVNTPMVHVEILKLDKDESAAPNELGRVVVTDLTSTTMPFIRYDTGDLSSYSEGDIYDGVLFYMNNIQGRSLDYITTPSGDLIPGLKINNLAFWKEDSVLTYQFIQETPSDYKMIVVPRDNFIEKDLVLELKSLLGEEAHLTIEKVADIPLMQSGKRRYIINKTQIK